jgi:hypothetical protein
MAKLQLFQYAVILHKKRQSTATEAAKTNEIEGSELIIEPTWIMAKDNQSVAFLATRKIDEKYVSDPELIEIQVRNF